MMLVAALPSGVRPQSTVSEIRCFLVSTGFARLSKDDGVRRAAGMTASFYLGRLDGRLSPSALTAAIRAQGKGLPAERAGTAMRTCAARAAAAERQMATASQQAGLGK